MRLLLIPLSLIPLTASAGEPECASPFTEADFRELVQKARSAIDQGDVEAHREVLGGIEQGIPCLAGQLPSRPWADYLVTEAVIRHADELPGWQTYLQLALDLVPDHPDVPKHVMRDYFPPPEPPGSPIPIPEGQIIVLDGRILTGVIPPLQGLHVAQAVKDGRWRSTLVRGQSFPMEWLTTATRDDPPPPPPTEGNGSWGAAGLTGGFGAWGQNARDVGDLEDTANGGTSFGGATHGVQKLGEVPGVFWSAHLSAQSSPATGEVEGARRVVPFGSAFAGVSLFDEPLSVWIGGGVAPTRVTDTGDGAESTLWMPHYLVGVGYRAAVGIPLDVSGGGGWGPWGLHAQGHAGASVASFGPLALRVGADGFYARSTVVNSLQAGSPVVARTGVWSGGLHVGVAWGVSE